MSQWLEEDKHSFGGEDDVLWPNLPFMFLTQITLSIQQLKAHLISHVAMPSLVWLCRI